MIGLARNVRLMIMLATNDVLFRNLDRVIMLEHTGSMLIISGRLGLLSLTKMPPNNRRQPHWFISGLVAASKTGRSLSNRIPHKLLAAEVRAEQFSKKKALCFSLHHSIDKLCFGQSDTDNLSASVLL